MAEVNRALAPLPKGRHWLERLEAALTRWDDSARPRGTVYLLIDCSTSMSDGNKLTQAKLGALGFSVEAWQRQYAVGIIKFSTSASCLLKARGSYPLLYKPLERLKADGRTAMADAIDLARRKLLRCKGHRVISLITDGKPDCRESTLRSASLARASGIEVIAVGTDGADEAFLSALAGRRELVMKVPSRQLEKAVSSMVGMLPEH